jgi:gliding motility-associated-like protein
MRYYLALIILLFSFNLSFSQSTIFYEDFNNAGCPQNCQAVGYNGWTVTNTGVNGLYPNQWFVSCAEGGHLNGQCGTGCVGAPLGGTLHIASTIDQYNYLDGLGLGFFLPCTTGDCGAAYLDGSGLVDATTNVRVESPVIDCSLNNCNIFLKFLYIENGNLNLDNFTVDYFDGVSWAQLSNPPKTPLLCAPQGQWTSYQVQLPASAQGNPNVKIGFKWTNDDNGVATDPSVAIDSVVIYTPSIGNASLSLSNPYCPLDFYTLSITNPEPTSIYNWDIGNTAFLFPSVTTTGSFSVGVAGSYPITITEINNCGTFLIIDTLISQDCVVNLTASFSAPDSVCIGANATFIDLSTPAGAATGWTWTFPGSDPVADLTLQNPGFVTWPTAGTYSVNLFITDGIFISDTTIDIVVYDCTAIPLIASFTSPDSVCTGACAAFNDQSTPAGSVTGWTWTFPSSNPVADLTLQNQACVVWANPGTYSVNLSVTDGTLTNDTTINIVAYTCPVPPTVDIIQSNDSVCVGSALAFTQDCTNATTYAWTFQGGTPLNANGAGPINVTYNTAGVYNVTLSATGPGGTTSQTFNLVVTAYNCVNVVANFTTSSDTICAGSSLLLFNNSVAPATSQYGWNFSGGSPATFIGAAPPTITFASAGTYTITLGVFDPVSSATDTFTYDVVVENCPVPVANFVASSTNICKSDSVVFTDASLNSSIWTWSFPGGNPANFGGQVPPPIFYANSGTYTATLLVQDGNGNDSTYSVQIVVTSCGAPEIAFSSSDSVICAGDCIQFYDLSDGSPTGWLWDFPGAIPTFSSQQNPPYICFPDAGLFNIQLTGFNNLGVDSLLQTGFITVNPLPTITTNFDSTEIVVGTSVDLSASGGVTYQWYPDLYLDDDSSATPIATPDVTTTYTVTTTDANGCTNQRVVIVNVVPPNGVFVPNLFTPNNDKVNDKLFAYTSGDVTKIEYSVFDRWGTRVFFTNDASIGWDGTYNSKDCNTGVYIWFYRAQFKNGKVIKGKGDVTLIR